MRKSLIFPIGLFAFASTAFGNDPVIEFGKKTGILDVQIAMGAAKHTHIYNVALTRGYLLCLKSQNKKEFSALYYHFTMIDPYAFNLLNISNESIIMEVEKMGQEKDEIVSKHLKQLQMIDAETAEILHPSIETTSIITQVSIFSRKFIQQMYSTNSTAPSILLDMYSPNVRQNESILMTKKMELIEKHSYSSNITLVDETSVKNANDKADIYLVSQRGFLQTSIKNKNIEIKDCMFEMVVQRETDPLNGDEKYFVVNCNKIVAAEAQ